MGISASGQTIRVEGMNFYSLKDGRVTDIWTQLDGVALMQQLGAIRPDAGSTPGVRARTAVNAIVRVHHVRWPQLRSRSAMSERNDQSMPPGARTGISGYVPRGPAAIGGGEQRAVLLSCSALPLAASSPWDRMDPRVIAAYLGDGTTGGSGTGDAGTDDGGIMSNTLAE